jgi:hypothetical protein
VRFTARVVSNDSDLHVLEMPCRRRETIHLRPLVELARDRRTVRLPMLMGRNSVGDPVILDLATLRRVTVFGGTKWAREMLVRALVVGLLSTREPSVVRLEWDQRASGRSRGWIIATHPQVEGCSTSDTNRSAATVVVRPLRNMASPSNDAGGASLYLGALQYGERRGNGDATLRTAGNDPSHIQTPYVSSEELKAVFAWYRTK